MGFFDNFLKGSGRNFYVKDFQNAYRFKPDINPGRQKFQGYVNFIFNRDLYATLYGGDNELRTSLSSMVRTADLPGVQFQAETKNAFNRKKIVQTGVQYDPVNMTVLDTVGNEWLTTLMKYFSFYYMDPRNMETDPSDRDIQASITRTGNNENSYGGQPPGFDGESKWNSNTAGFNINPTSNFFERIDYVIYHGNKGVQYSLINPILQSFKPNQIDYADSAFREFELSFIYEKFTVYSATNFNLTAEDVDRFENASALTGPAFATREDQKPYELRSDRAPREMTFLGAQGIETPRTIQDTVQPPPTEASTGEEGEGDSPPETTTVPPTTYGDGAIDWDNISNVANEAQNKSLGFGDLLLDVVDNSVAALINGGSVKDAAIGAFATGIGGVINNINDPFEIKPSAPNPEAGMTDFDPGIDTGNIA